MDKFIAGLIIGLVAILMIGLMALVGGTIVFWLWPYAIPALFPAQVAAGTLLASVPWWPTVLFTWICGILFKGSSGSSK